MAGYFQRFVASSPSDPGWQSPPRLPDSPRKRALTSTDRLRTIAFYASAVVVGLIVRSLLLSAFSPGLAPPPPHGDRLWDERPYPQPPPPGWHPPPPPPFENPCPESLPKIRPPASRYGSFVRPGLGQFVTYDENEYGESEVKEMIATTKGFYARDYSLWLGWNNMRYIIEAALLHAQLLNRTLIIPSFVYARSCEAVDIEACAAYLPMVNRGDAIGTDQWQYEPIRQQMGWKVPTSVMIDLVAIRRVHPVITVSDYLEIHGLDPTLETGNGAWNREAYHNVTNDSFRPTLFEIPNEDFDPERSTRVDRLLPNQEQQQHFNAPKSGTTEATFLHDLGAKYDKWDTADLSDVVAGLEAAGLPTWKTDAQMVGVLARYGLSPVYTFHGSAGNMRKSVVDPITKVAPIHTMKGLVEDYGGRTEDVLLIGGELHDQRKPGSLFFTSREARDEFAAAVLYSVVHQESVQVLADAVAAHMLELNDGRMWMAAHWRRGDFVRYSITLEPSVPSGLAHITKRLKDGRELLQAMAQNKTREIPQVPAARMDNSFDHAPPPLPDDKWFLATDERDPKALKAARSQNAILISELLESTPELRRLVGWPLLFGDVLALVEQQIMARAAVFFGQARSSVVGGVVNIRGLRGMDPRTTLLDHL